MEKKIDKDCIFCKIANGEIPSSAIYEDDDFKVIMDINPASKGHCIILPKTHAANLFELPDEWCEKVMPVAKKCATVLKDVLGCEGVNVLQNNGELAGQTVFHLHVHLIPRYQDDSVSIEWSHGDAKDVEELAQKIKAGFEK